MPDVKGLARLVSQFSKNIDLYKSAATAYNEHSCRIEYIDPMLRILGWDVENSKGLAPQYREVIAENYTNQTDRPDYSLTLRGVAKLFVEAKKPAVDISTLKNPALQARRYGWNAGHKIAVLTNFEYLAIYDTTYIPAEDDSSAVARYRLYHFTEYLEKIEEIHGLMSRQAVYSGAFDKYFNNVIMSGDAQRMPVDKRFLQQINEWRISLSNELCRNNRIYSSLDILNDAVQLFINQIVFLRICEDKNLPTYHKLSEVIADEKELKHQLEKLFREADKKYNSGMFSGDYIIFDLTNDIIVNMIKGLYYPNSPYMFNIIEPNMLGKIYEMFLTEQLQFDGNRVILTAREKCLNRSVVTTPAEIVIYIVKLTLKPLCDGKTPAEIKQLKIADIACGSGVFLEEAFEYLQAYCIEWYLKNDRDALIEIGNGRYKLPLSEKKELLCSCIYGIDIDIHAVEVAKFSLLMKLTENETAPSVMNVKPILPSLENNIFHGNSLVGNEDSTDLTLSAEDLLKIAPFDWENQKFDAIIGNPPYVNTAGMHMLLASTEFDIYKAKYKTAYKQFDKYFIFLERALQKVKNGGYVGYIVPNKFFKINAGQQLRKLIADNRALVHLDDFGDAQLFEDKTIYSSILLLQNAESLQFEYTQVNNITELLTENFINRLTFNADYLNEDPWLLTTDRNFLALLDNLEKISVPITDIADVFNGIQTSAERPEPVYWFSADEVIEETDSLFKIKKNNREYCIEKTILKPFFKPTKSKEKGLNSYSLSNTDKHIIFPYNENGDLIPEYEMEHKFPGAYKYLYDNYDRLLPKSVAKKGKEMCRMLPPKHGINTEEHRR